MELRPRAAKALSEFRGVERNLLARKFFQSIQYSKESIQINLFYPNPARFGAGQGQAGQGFEHKNASALCGGEFLKKQNGSLARARTSDPLVNSQLLYQLSYQGKTKFLKNSF